MIEEEFQQAMNKINKNIRNIEIRKEPAETNGNVAILTTTKTETAEQTIKKINNTGKWSASKIGNKTNLEYNRTNTNTYKGDDREESTDSHRQKDSTKCYAGGTRDHKIKHCNKNCNIFVSYRDEEYLNEKELHDIAIEYGKVRKLKIKTDRYGVEEKCAMICYTTEDEAQKAIECIKNKEEWTAERYKIKWGIKDQENKKYNNGNRINSRTTEKLETQCYACM